jgi:hypothetical protein
MFNNLDLKHIFNCLELAFQLNIEDLKSKSIEFAVKNKHQVQENEEWEPLIQRCPQISITFMRCLTKESDELVKKIKELEASLEAQKCMHHRCPIPYHEMLLRQQRHVQPISGNMRNRDQPPFRNQERERFNEMLRQERRRRGLPPLENLRGAERAQILQEALERYRLRGWAFIDSDDDNVGYANGENAFRDWRARRNNLQIGGPEIRQNNRNGELICWLFYGMGFCFCP